MGSQDAALCQICHKAEANEMTIAGPTCTPCRVGDGLDIYEPLPGKERTSVGTMMMPEEPEPVTTLVRTEEGYSLNLTKGKSMIHCMACGEHIEFSVTVPPDNHDAKLSLLPCSRCAADHEKDKQRLKYLIPTLQECRWVLDTIDVTQVECLQTDEDCDRMRSTLTKLKGLKNWYEMTGTTAADMRLQCPWCHSRIDTTEEMFRKADGALHTDCEECQKPIRTKTTTHGVLELRRDMLEFEARWEDSGCTCHIAPPCSYCVDGPGGLEEYDD